MPYAPALPGQQVIFRPPLRPVRPVMRRRRVGLGSLGVDCSTPVLRSNYYTAPCTLGQGAATQQCLSAQDAAEQQFFADWAACNPDSAAGVNPNQIIGVPGQTPTQTLYQAAQQIYGGVVPQGTFQNVSGGPGGTLQFVPQSQLSVPVSAPAGSGSSAPTGTFSMQAASYVVGGKWTLSIRGAKPNSPVTASSSQNGKSNGVSSFGTTDAAGNFSLSGTFTPDTVGSWSESWLVAGLPVGSASFTVTAAPGSSGGGSAAGSSGGGGTSGGASGSGAGGGGTPGTSGTPTSFDLQGLLAGSAFFGIPNWVLGAVVIGGVYVLGGHHRG